MFPVRKTTPSSGLGTEEQTAASQDARRPAPLQPVPHCGPRGCPALGSSPTQECTSRPPRAQALPPGLRAVHLLPRSAFSPRDLFSAPPKGARDGALTCAALCSLSSKFFPSSHPLLQFICLSSHVCQALHKGLGTEPCPSRCDLLPASGHPASQQAAGSP